MAQLKNTTISDTGSLNLPAGTTAQRPTSPAGGQIRYNTDINDTEYYDGGAWRPISDSNPEATGGTVVDTDIGGVPYRIHLFTNTGNSTFAVSRGGEVEYLIVAGGGGGGAGRASESWWSGGGGGAGGLISSSLIAERTTNYTITVGAGGLGQVAGTNHQTSTDVNGSNSSAFGQTALGGGAGASYIDSGNLTGRSGGSGGGGAGGSSSGGTATAGQGNIGGGGVSGGTPGGGASGGGGGAGSPGINGIDGQSGAGGQGLANSITGSTVYYAGGGGGGGPNTGGYVVAPGTGGPGGGGSGSSSITGFGNSGAPNTGGGGGGMGGSSSINNTGGAGGSGIVVVRYRRNATTATQPNQTRPSFLPFFYNRDVRPITARTGLVLELDAANPLSNSITGTVSGSSWQDLSSRQRNPNILASLTSTGQSLVFPGNTTNYVEHTDFYNTTSGNSIFQGTPPQTTTNWSGNSTYIAWVRPSILDATPRHIFTDTNFNEGEIEFRNVSIRFSWGSGNTVTVSTVLDIGEWYQIVQTHLRNDPADEFLYEGHLNGQKIMSTTRPISTTATSYGPDSRLVIGYDFAGEMSLIQVYDRVLSDEEIRQNYIAFTARYGG